MSCNITYASNGEVKSVNADNGNTSLLYKEATKKFGKEQGLEIYLASKSDYFQDNILLSQSELDENNEPKLRIVLNYLSLQNESKEPLTTQQKLDLKNIALGVENFSVQKLVDAFYSDGIFDVSPKKLKKSGLYSDYEIANLANDIDLQQTVKQSLEALKNTEEIEIEEEFVESLEKTAEINSFGKLTNINPNLVQKEVLEKLAGTTEEEFEANLAEVEYPNFQKKLEKPVKKTLIQKVIDQLRKNKLANNIYIYTNAQIEQKLREFGVNVNKQVDAYHGSPYSFDRFTTNAMGTGEGAQAFGWGLYFTDLESIARNYAKVLSNKNSYFVDDVVDFKSELRGIFNNYEFTKNFSLPSIDSNGVIDQITLDVFIEQFQQLEQTFSLDKKKLQDKDKNSTGILPQYLSEFNKMYESIEKRVQEYNNFIKEIKEFEEDFDFTILSNKNLYKVSLHKGKTPSEYTWLEWDTQTAKEVKEKFSNIIKNENLKGEIHNIKLSDKYDVDSYDGGKTWKVGDTTKIGTEEEFVATFKDKKEAEKEAYKLNFVESNMTGKDLYEALAKQIGQKEASLFLLKNGIDGIKYPAESISRGATSDTARGFNYVVFDENVITIEEQIQFQRAENLADEYLRRITEVKQASPQDYWSVDIPSQETIQKAAKDGRIVKNSGGMALVTEDGNLIGLFKDGNQKGISKELDEKRIALGGIKKDNFDGYLTKLYKERGFRVVSRVPFNEEYAPEGWSKELHGTPDVVVMIYDPQNKLNIEEKTFTDYDEAMAYRDSFVDEARALNPTTINFQRVADQLPLTLSVFDNKSFVEMRGKMVSPITVLNSLNQSGIKQIEKDLIKQVIEQNYQGQKKISYDELEATVRANIMPLERIFTSSYANYGMDNLGNGNYGEANTIILNAPIEHGVTGHFSGDFKASGRKNIKYQPKQLDANTWVAVEEGYEANANNNNIYQYVGTAGTKEAVDEWIANYENPGNLLLEEDTSLTIRVSPTTQAIRDNFPDTDVVKVELLKDGEVVYVRSNAINNEDREFLRKRTIENYNLSRGKELDKDTQAINKGMFGHIRVWQDGQDYYVAELQSDYFQKNNAKKNLIENSKEYENWLENKREELNKATKDFNEKMKSLYIGEEVFMKLIEQVKGKAPKNWEINEYNTNSTRDYRIYIEGGIEVAQLTIDFTKKSNYAIVYEKETVDTEMQGLFDKINGDRKTLVNSFEQFKEDFKKNSEKERLKKIEQLLLKATPQEKQFIASQKIWEQRMVREAIKEASLSGATSLRFPTPYTLSVIEGYIEGDGTGAIQLNSEGSTEIGDTLEYLGEDYTIMSQVDLEDGVRIVRSSEVREIVIEDFIDEQVAYEMGEVYIEEGDKFYSKDTLDNSDAQRILDDRLEQKAEEDGTELEDTVLDITADIIEEIRDTIRTRIKDDVEFDSERYFSDWGYENIVERDGVVYHTVEGIESEYVSLKQNSQSKEEFDISDLSETQQTVARKYEEIAEILKKEKTVEVVTDENGFNWYEAKIEQNDVNKPVVAFQKTPKDVTLTTAGFVHKGDVYLNEDKMGLDTPVHELGHLYLNYLKSNSSDIYERGLQLAQSEDAREYIDYVERTQPQLTGEAKLNEILAQAIGDNGAKLADKSWIEDLWDAIRELFGLSQYTNKQVQNMNLKQFTEAIAVDLYKNQLFQEMQGYKKAEVFMEVDGEIVQAKNTNTAVILPLVAKQIDNIEDINKLQQYDLEILQANQEDTVKILKGIETDLIVQGIDVAGLADKEINANLMSFLGELEVFINKPTVENTKAFADVYDAYFEKDLSPKIEIIKAQETDRDFVKLNTNLSEEQVYEQQGLIKVKDGLYIRTNKQELNTLYSSLETYTEKYPKDVNLKEYVQTQIATLDFKNSDNAEAVYLYKMYFGVDKKQQELFEYNNLIKNTREKINDFIKSEVTIKQNIKSLYKEGKYKLAELEEIGLNRKRTFIEDSIGLAFRAGEIIGRANPPEVLANFRGGRGTGHFGTGFYFLGATSLEERDIYESYPDLSRAMSIVEVNDYNLLRIRDNIIGLKLHEELKNFSGGARGFEQLETEEQIARRLYNNDDKVYEIAKELYSNALGYLEAGNFDKEFVGDISNFDKSFEVDWLSNGGRQYAQSKMNNFLFDYLKSKFDFYTSVPNINYYIEALPAEFIERVDNTLEEYLVDKTTKEDKRANFLYKMEGNLKNLASIIVNTDNTQDYENVLKIITEKYSEIFEQYDPYNLEVSKKQTTIGTQLLISLGYNGIDVRGVGESQGITALDNTSYGSVIYDINKTISGSKPIIKEFFKKEAPPTTQTSNFTGNYEYLTTEFVSDFYIEMLKEREKNSEIYKNFYSNFDVNENGIYLKNEDNITMSQVKEYLSNPVTEDLSSVVITKTDSSNPSFSDMQTFSIDGGKMEIGLINGASNYSILVLNVDEDKRRQGRAEKLLKKGLLYTDGKLSGQASNDASVALNYKLGMRAYSKLDNSELTLEETKKQRSDSAGESIRMILPLNQKVVNKTFENLKQYSIISKQMPLLTEQEIQSETKQVRRDAILNSPQNLEKYQGQYHKLNDNNLILKNSDEEFIKVGGNIFEAVDTDGNLTLYSRLNSVVGEYNTFENEAPKTNVKIEDYSYLNTQPEKFLTEKSYLSKSAKEKINRENFDCI